MRKVATKTIKAIHDTGRLRNQSATSDSPFLSVLWDVVAFVRKLPELTPEQYEALVKNAPKHEELMQDMEMRRDDNHTDKHEHE
jgi:hypothetical protein